MLEFLQLLTPDIYFSYDSMLGATFLLSIYGIRKDSLRSIGLLVRIGFNQVDKDVALCQAKGVLLVRQQFLKDWMQANLSSLKL